ncbi:MarR family winged helix-turn-helix transcriptional regulator [Pseudosulfitobacter koreensis]|uniref:MarR family winged helix-turn-helix transcriptional regulator n=1 Tax=Pseudosulfitobacter koreensis TaxID=2968472 RepID=A0ABT1Z4Z7_9RHOB|nr:MarR family winged helix-turn-helix transcriptional regulator [Pseudosulfitobacter koreense]MCR8828206.1 MarR family winged helix-turn-helix transcriptional regulator [Pseudosulfitobacter koreense]
MNDSEQSISQSDLRQYLTYRLSKLQTALNVQATRTLSAHSNITLTEWRVLFILCSKSSATMSVIMKESRLDKALISRSVKGLVEKGYIVSVQDKSDKRRHPLNATDAGRALKEKILPIMFRRQQALTDGIPPAELETFFKVLEQLETVALRRDF